MDKTINIVLGAIIALLGGFGIITAGEGTSLATYGAEATTGLIGLVQVVLAIVKRRKGVADPVATPSAEK